MKKLLLFLLILPLAVGCAERCRGGRDGVWREENGKLKVLSTIEMIDDLVQKIGQDYVDSTALIRGGLDPHSYELVKGDDEKFVRADIIFYNGLGLEHGLSLSRNLIGNGKAVPVSEWLLHDHEDRLMIGEGQYDPHIWMDISLWMETIDPIVAELSQKDPDHAEQFRENGRALREEMERADNEIVERLHRIPAQRRYLVTSHDAFNYFTRRYLAEPGEGERWQDRCCAPEGLAPDAQLSIVDMRKIVDHIGTHNISVVFTESNVNKDSLKKIVSTGRAKGFAVRLSPEELYGDAMGKSGSYLEMIAHNVDVIARSFGGEL
ncbi:MAG: Periplasmic zinc-binding protein TroA [Chlamydiae bacterium]|nr:Periplasmic zinc-binding protein TroA [Chlamydiota bacterium]